MDQQAKSKAVDILIEAREAVATFPGFPEDCRPRTPADGYALQRAFMAATEWPVAGWKLGATDANIQKMFNTDEPFYGPVFVSGLMDAPAVVPRDRFQTVGLESEFAFSLARDLAPRDARYEVDEVADAVATMLPAVEIISPRLDHLTRHGLAAAIADGAIHGGLILGLDVHDWREADLETAPVRLLVDGEEVAAGVGANALGSPLKALAWFVNRFTGTGETLAAGSVVSTGTCTGVIYLEAGQQALADFGPLGHVHLSVAGEEEPASLPVGRW